MEGDGHLRQIVDSQHQQRPRRREQWWLIAIALGTPVLLVIAMFLEDAGLPNFTPGYDLSRTVITSIAGVCVLVGLAVIISGVRRGLRGLYPTSSGPGRWRSAIRTARDRRLSGIVLIALGSLITFFSVVVLVVRLTGA